MCVCIGIGRAMFIKPSPIPRALVASRQCHRLSSIARTHVCRRTYAAAATATKASTSSTPFTVSQIGGVKVVVRDDGGPTTGLSVVLRAGSRYCPLPGAAHILEKFAWKVDNQFNCCIDYRVGYSKADCVSSYTRDGIVGRSFVIKFISRNCQCLCTMSS